MRVTTCSGTIYDLDLAAMTVVRSRNPYVGLEMRRDEEVLPLLDLQLPVTLGQRMVMTVDVRGDGIDTLRSTSQVESCTTTV